jgi:hypothetical protein
MTEDPRVDPLGNNAILTDTRIRISLAPRRPEVRVVALEQSVRAAQIERLASMTQQGVVHLQLKEGFAPERHYVLSPAELALLYDMLDKFITELPRVDRGPAADPKPDAE